MKTAVALVILLVIGGVLFFSRNVESGDEYRYNQEGVLIEIIN